MTQDLDANAMDAGRDPGHPVWGRWQQVCGPAAGEHEGKWTQSRLCGAPSPWRRGQLRPSRDPGGGQGQPRPGSRGRSHGLGAGGRRPGCVPGRCADRVQASPGSVSHSWPAPQERCPPGSLCGPTPALGPGRPCWEVGPEGVRLGWVSRDRAHRAQQVAGNMPCRPGVAPPVGSQVPTPPGSGVPAAPS